MGKMPLKSLTRTVKKAALRLSGTTMVKKKVKLIMTKAKPMGYLQNGSLMGKNQNSFLLKMISKMAMSLIGISMAKNAQ